MFLVCTFFTNWKLKLVEFQLWFFLYQRNFDQNQNLLLLDINKEIIIRYFIEIYDVNKTQVLGWDTYWNLPHLPDLTGSSPCPNRPGGKNGGQGGNSQSFPPSPDLAIFEATFVQSNVELVKEWSSIYCLRFTYSEVPNRRACLLKFFRFSFHSARKYFL